MTNQISRRELSRRLRGMAVTAAAFGGKYGRAQGALTGTQLVELIKGKLADEGVVWRPSLFDGFHLGEPNIAVTGVAVTFQATFDVLQRAASTGKNFVVSHECTFWDGFDPVEVMQDDPVCQAKIRFAREHKMAAWRIHDHWHRRRPDPVFSAIARKLGWTEGTVEGRPRRHEIPESSLHELARHVQHQLGTKNVVVVGDPDLRVKSVGDCIHVLSTVLPALSTCDVALVGETGQYDTFEYVRDAVSAGLHKGLIMISHQALEEWGMQDFAEWLKPAVPGLPVEWLNSGDPFEVPALRI